MKSWLDESGDDQLLLRSVWPAAEEWHEQGRNEEWLWGDDPRLPRLREMSAELNQLELEFLGASVDAARVALAREWMSEDPTRAALVLRELVNVETGGAVSTILEVLGQPVAAAVFPDSGLGAFSADGTRILTASVDGTVRVWNADGSGPPVILRGHEDLITSGVFNADGTKVLTASADGTARVWERRRLGSAGDSLRSRGLGDERRFQCRRHQGRHCFGRYDGKSMGRRWLPAYRSFSAGMRAG